MISLEYSRINKIVEVGCGYSPISMSKVFWQDISKKVILIEPNIFFYKNLLDEISKFSNIQCYNCAIYDKNELVNFFLVGQSSYIEGVDSPLQTHLRGCANVFYKRQKVVVPAFKIDFFDKKDIDYLIISNEGCEFFVLKYLISRPIFIFLQIYNLDGYKMPFSKEIFNWFNDNNYHIINRTSLGILLKRI